MRSTLLTGVVGGLLVGLVRSAAAAPEPAGPHPRLLLDAGTIERLREQQRDRDSGIAAAIAQCDAAIADPVKYRSGGYQGLAFASYLSSCALAWRVTDDAAHAAAGLRYFEAVLEDFREVGDGAGGDDVVRHNSGYAMRAFAPAAALAYDWMHDAPGMSEELRALARRRFKAWTDWYRRDGYLRDAPGANYHAGYAFGVALIALAQAGEAGDAGAELWRFAEELFRGPIGEAMGPGGVLAGGDWPEGWQYGPLSVLELSLAGRALVDHGVELPALAAWSDSLVVRWVHALTPDRRRWYIGGDTGDEVAYAPVNGRALYAVLSGRGSARARSWARAELTASRFADREFPAYQALAEAAAVDGAPFPREREPTWYLASGSGNLYVRTSWRKDAVWMVATCAPQRVPDHQQLSAGSFVLSRGGDDLIVDPSPYGSLSSLTSNAPTVESAHLPSSYRPSQAPWGRRTGFAWVGQAVGSGATVARCDYTDQYRFKDEPPDVELAMRDLALVPLGSGAVLVVRDRARTGAKHRGLHLRFRSGHSLRESGGAIGARIGDSSLAIARLGGEVGRAGSIRALPTEGHCWDVPRGGCDLSRLSGTEYRTVVPGPDPDVVHVIVAASQRGAARSRLDGKGVVYGIRVEVDGREMVVVTGRDGDAIEYVAPRGAVHVVIGGAAAGRKVATVPEQAGCRVTIEPPPQSGSHQAAADTEMILFSVDASCHMAVDPAPSALPRVAIQPRSPVGRRGCVGCSAVGGVGGLSLLLPLLALFRRRGGRRRGAQR